MLNLNHALLIGKPLEGALLPNYESLANSFCGKVFRDVGLFNEHARALQTPILLYLCGEMDPHLLGFSRDHVIHVYVISELSPETLLRDVAGAELVSIGQVPHNIHSVAVLFPRLFDRTDKDFFDAINREHALQELKLSNKPGMAFRKGIYLTPVEELPDGGGLKFKLLRCSTNLNGPSDNFRETDHSVVGRVNHLRSFFLPGTAELNHVLAQTYHNSVSPSGKQKKARISAHSDKTKDMPPNGVMAFCTFYEGYDSQSGFMQSAGHSWQTGTVDPFDWVYGKCETSILTRLRFCLKPQARELFPHLPHHFDVTLYPNSVLLMSLETNRLYTHEISPSLLPVDMIPVRMGYVIRCSDTEAIHVNGTTLIASPSGFRPLEDVTPKGEKELARMYFLENTTIDPVDYRDKFYFSMNSGDYLAPLL